MFVSRNSIRNESLLNILEVKHQMITANIANADTPGYKAKKVEFEEELAKLIRNGNTGNLQLTRTHASHLPLSRSSVIPYQITEDTDSIMNNNQNNVDIDAEMAGLASNQLAYQFMIDKVSGHYNKYKKLLADMK